MGSPPGATVVQSRVRVAAVAVADRAEAPTEWIASPRMFQVMRR